MNNIIQNKMIDSPILFLIFNRPNTTNRVFERIKEARPKKLYIAADGPRPQKQGEKEKCLEARKIVSKIDWDCDVKTLFRDTNIGCKKAVSSAIDWFFENEEMGIILEDDCLPDPSFFTFCEKLLIKYKDDKRIMHIGGSNFHNGWTRDNDYSYYFSIHGHIWGWATWRRAWQLYDVNLKVLPEIISKRYLRGFLTNDIELQAKLRKLKKIYNNNLDTWDYQWEFTLYINSGLAIIPNTNLVENIGFGPDATHTTNAKDRGQMRKTSAIKFPLKHPNFIVRDKISDNKFYYGIIKNKIISKMLKFLP